MKGDIENVAGVLKVTRIGVTYHLKIPHEKAEEARKPFPPTSKRCPAAQSVIGCIRIEDDLVIEEIV